MTVRNIKKSLIGMEDLAQGVGTATQTRAGSSVDVGLVDTPYAVDSVAKMQVLDVDQFTRARVYSDVLNFVDYVYDPLGTSGVAPDVGSGFWIALNSGSHYLTADTIADAKADDTLQYRIGQFVRVSYFATGIQIDKLYEILAAGTETADDGLVHDSTTASLFQLKLVGQGGETAVWGINTTDCTVLLQNAINSLTPGPSGGGVISLDFGKNYTISGAGIVIPPNVTLDHRSALVTYTGNGVAFTLGNSDTVLSKSCKSLNMSLKLQEKDSTGVRLRGTDAAWVTGNMEGHTTVMDNTRSNIGVDIDGVDVSSFFNRISMSLGHMHQGFRIGTTGSVDPTVQYFDNCDVFGDQSTDDTSIGYNFVGNSFGGQGTVISGGNIELCNTGMAFNSGAGQVTVIGTRFEINQTGTAWKLDFANGCDPCMFIGLQGFGTTYMESASGIRNFDSNSHTWIGTDGALRLNGFDDPLNAKNFLGLGGSNPQLRFDSGADVNVLIDDDNTGTGRYIVQAGRGSGSFGAGITLHGHAHASNPGDCLVYPSSGAGEFKVTSGLGGGDRFRVSSTQVTPGVDSTSSLGVAALRWTEVHADNATINTSDGRHKTTPLAIDDAVLDAWATVDFVQYQMLDAVDKKGADSARIHFGVVAQQIKSAFEAAGLDPMRYSLLCYDEWDDAYQHHEAQYAEKLDENGCVLYEYDEDGEEIKGELIKEAWTEHTIVAGNRYGVRYEQCMVLEMALTRRRLNNL